MYRCNYIYICALIICIYIYTCMSCIPTCHLLSFHDYFMCLLTNSRFFIAVIAGVRKAGSLCVVPRERCCGIENGGAISKCITIYGGLHEWGSPWMGGLHEWGSPWMGVPILVGFSIRNYPFKRVPPFMEPPILWIYILRMWCKYLGNV